MGEFLQAAYDKKIEEDERLEREKFLNDPFDSENPKISVIMAVYNTKEEWLREVKGGSITTTINLCMNLN